jgi:hypothetical protein
MATDPPRTLRSSCFSSTKHTGRALLLALAVLPSCAVYDSSLLDTHAGVTEATGGGESAVGGRASAGQSNAAEGGKGSSTNSSAGDSSSVGSGGASANGDAGGTGVGTAGSGSASSGGAGSASNGGAPSGSGGMKGSAGTGSTGSAGAVGAGAGGSGSTAGAASGGSAGSGGAPINPCDRTSWKATASESSVNPANPPALAIDGLAATRWSTGTAQVGGEWFLLDLGARAAHLTQLVLDSSGSPDDQPLTYKVEMSDDGKSYALVCTGTGATMTVVKFVDTPARYIRITQTGSDPNANWWSIQELTLTCSPN